MTAYEQRSYPGTAADTLLAADITAGATAFSVTAGTGGGYPDGTGGPFFVIVDYDNSKAEKIRCSGRVNDTFTVAGTGGGRGQDGTSAVGHSTPAKVRAVWTATDAQEANRAALNTVGKVTSKGDLLAGTGANALARVPAGANGTIPIFDSTQAAGIRAGANPSLAGATLDATSTHGGVSGTTLAADHAAWTVFTPSLPANWSNVTCAYLLIGKTLHIRWAISFTGTVATTNPGLTSLPASLQGQYFQPIHGAVVSPVGTATMVTSTGGLVDVYFGAAYTNPICYFAGVIQVA